MNKRFLRFFVAPTPRRRKIILRPRGAVYDLDSIGQELSSKYFNVSFSHPITWFGSGKIPKTRVLFGSYSYQTGLIKVNRILDSKKYPLFFIRFIVYHEMLHHFYPPKRGKRGRWDIHHSEFRAREQKFEQYNEVQSFLKEWKYKYFSFVS